MTDEPEESWELPDGWRWASPDDDAALRTTPKDIGPNVVRVDDGTSSLLIEGSFAEGTGTVVLDVDIVAAILRRAGWTVRDPEEPPPKTITVPDDSWVMPPPPQRDDGQPRHRVHRYTLQAIRLVTEAVDSLGLIENDDLYESAQRKLKTAKETLELVEDEFENPDDPDSDDGLVDDNDG